MRRQLCDCYCSGYNADNVYESNIVQTLAVYLSRDYTDVYFRFMDNCNTAVFVGMSTVRKTDDTALEKKFCDNFNCFVFSIEFAGDCILWSNKGIAHRIQRQWYSLQLWGSLRWIKRIGELPCCFYDVDLRFFYYHNLCTVRYGSKKNLLTTENVF